MNTNIKEATSNQPARSKAGKLLPPVLAVLLLVVGGFAVWKYVIANESRHDPRRLSPEAIARHILVESASNRVALAGTNDIPLLCKALSLGPVHMMSSEDRQAYFDEHVDDFNFASEKYFLDWRYIFSVHEFTAAAWESLNDDERDEVLALTDQVLKGKELLNRASIIASLSSRDNDEDATYDRDSLRADLSRIVSDSLEVTTEKTPTGIEVKAQLKLDEAKYQQLESVFQSMVIKKYKGEPVAPVEVKAALDVHLLPELKEKWNRKYRFVETDDGWFIRGIRFWNRPSGWSEDQRPPMPIGGEATERSILDSINAIRIITVDIDDFGRDEYVLEHLGISKDTFSTFTQEQALYLFKSVIGDELMKTRREFANLEFGK